MATIAEFSVPTHAFALAETLPRFPTVAVEADRIAAHIPDSTMPCLWAAEGDVTGFADAVAADRTVASVKATMDFDTECLYHVIWEDEINDLVTEMIDHEGVILEASARDEEWRLRLRFMSQEQFEHFQSHFADRVPQFRLERVFSATHPRHTRGDVTTDQHEALTTAVDLGYFHVPRDGSIQDVADALGVSDQAVSERIRRGTENLVRDMLTVEPIRDRT